MATLNEALSLVDDIANELSFYDVGNYKQLGEQTAINRCKDLMEKVKTSIMAKDPDGVIRADKLSSDDWRRISSLVAPLARCFTVLSPPVAPTMKTRHASAMAVAALALLSSCNVKSKTIVTSALENGVVDAFVKTLRNSLRNQVPDRVVKAMLYKLIESLWGFTLYATTQLQQEMVAKDVVNVCLDLVTSNSMEIESKLNASKTLYNCLSSHGRVVTELRGSRVTALNQLVHQLASQVPDPLAAAQMAINSSASKCISMPQMLPSIMSWIWFLPSYIVDHLIDALSNALSRVVVLVWPEGYPGIPLMEPGRNEPAAGGLQVAQLSLPNRFLQKMLQQLFRAIASGIADMRLVSILRGARLPSAVHGLADSEDVDTADQDEELDSTCLPARLVKVVREGRPDGNETRVALELLDELFACDANGGHPELADDALAAGLLASMTEMGVLHSLHTEPGIAGVSAYVRLTMKLIKRVPYTPGLASRLNGSGVPASVAYVAFWPTSRVSLKLEALQTLYELVQVDTDMMEHVVAMNNFPIALTNALLGGDPDSRKPAKKSGASTSSKKKGGKEGSMAMTGATAAAVAAAEVSVSQRRDHRDQMQETAFNILAVVLDEARESNKVWETVVESGMLPRLVQHSCAFPMQPALLAELLLGIGITFKDHRENTASVGPLQAACAPHILPLLVHEENVVVAAAARVFRDIVLDMACYRSGSADVEEGDEILKALVAAGSVIDTADIMASKAAAVVAKAAAAAAVAMAAVSLTPKEGGVGASPEKSGHACSPDGEGGSTNGPVAPPGSSGPTPVDDSQRGVVQGDGMMEVDTGPGSTAATAAPPAYVGTTNTTAGPSGGATGAGRGVTGAVTAVPIVEATAATATAGPEPDAPELVDVTAHGLGLICAAIKMCIATLLRRPCTGSLNFAGALSSPSTKGGGATAASLGAAATRIRLEGPVYEALEALLLSCRVLSEACLHMPPHGTVRKHLARAFAYARPPVEDLIAALEARPEQDNVQLLRDSRAVLKALGEIPVLDVALLPKPKAAEEEEVNLAVALSGSVAPRKGRPPGSGKRSSQLNLAADGSAQPAPPTQPTKRQRTGLGAAMAATGDDVVAAPMGRTRAATLASGSGEHASTSSPHIPSLRGTSGPVTANGSALSVERHGAAEGFPSRGATLDAPGPVPGRGRSGIGRGTAGGPAGVTASAVPRSGPSGSGAVPLPGMAGAHQAGAGEGAAAKARLGMPLSSVPPNSGTRMESLKHEEGGSQQAAGPRAMSLSESPSISLEKRHSLTATNSGSAAAIAANVTVKQDSMAAATALGGAAAANGGLDGGGAKGRVNAAEFRARYLDMKAQNGRMAQELESLKLAMEEVEALQQKTAATLTSRTVELAKALEELEEKNQQLEALRKELQAAQYTIGSIQATMAGSEFDQRELEQLRAENADLKAELANLADLE